MSVQESERERMCKCVRVNEIEKERDIPIGRKGERVRKWMSERDKMKESMREREKRVWVSEWKREESI